MRGLLPLALVACAARTDDDGETRDFPGFAALSVPAGAWDDADGDGLLAGEDCDDGDARVGRLLFGDPMGRPTGDLVAPPQLGDHWAWAGGEVANVEGGQQALLGPDAEWGDTVTFATLRADGLEDACGADCSTERFRSGVLARAAPDADQDEGFHGYRCAIAANEEDDYWDVGAFLQIGAFLDAPEGEGSAETCEDRCADPAWEQLARVERTLETDLVGGDTARLVFWAVGNELVCEMYGDDDEYVRAEADVDGFVSNEGEVLRPFDTGRTGLSVLNAFTSYDSLRVCEVL